MIEWLWLVPLLPLAGSVVLMASRGEAPHSTVSAIGVGSVGLAAMLAIAIAAEFLGGVDAAASYTVGLGGWIAVGELSFGYSLSLDALSLVMMLVVTVVGFLIHLYSIVYMGEDEGYARFFAYMNLFMAAMLVLVLADNLLLLYLGWEGVGLCSYLLIGFWYRDPANGYAARKAFVVTRAGDTAMLIGLILLATELGTLHVDTALARAAEQWPPGSGIAVAAAALLLAGAVGKSAQLPLHTWLPDAMAGPTPVSALIHAATMVTAGMYLVARTHALFVLAPPVQLAVAVIGAASLLLAALAALGQSDIKRILAYSTMSQIGYMFLALGVGAWSAAVFHFMTHAFFKALLFLAAGALILALHHEQNIFRMGGLRRRMPGVFWAFLIGAGALAAVPLVTAGFYSKEQILTAAWSAERGGTWLWLAGLVAAFLTSVYIFRAVFIVFFGPPAARPHAEPRRLALFIPLAALSVLSVIGGFVETPPLLGRITWFSDLVGSALPAAPPHELAPGVEARLALAAAAAALGGIAVAWWLFLPRPERTRERIAERERGSPVYPALASAFGFDRLYDAVFVRPFLGLARALRGEPVDRLYDGLVWLLRASWQGAGATQTGRLRWYAAGMLAGGVIVIGIAVLA
ncbi:MAG TPA: NADH-quinone oxidoreductase subunit L [Gammaproteobacteria bacterium]